MPQPVCVCVCPRKKKEKCTNQNLISVGLPYVNGEHWKLLNFGDISTRMHVSTFAVG